MQDLQRALEPGQVSFRGIDMLDQDVNLARANSTEEDGRIFLRLRNNGKFERPAASTSKPQKPKQSHSTRRSRPDIDFISAPESEWEDPYTIPPSLHSLFVPPGSRLPEEAASVLEELRGLAFLNTLTDAQCLDLVNVAYLEVYSPGELVMRVGDRIDRVRLVVSGSFRSYSYTTSSLHRFRPAQRAIKEIKDMPLAEAHRSSWKSQENSRSSWKSQENSRSSWKSQENSRSSWKSPSLASRDDVAATKVSDRRAGLNLMTNTPEPGGSMTDISRKVSDDVGVSLFATVRETCGEETGSFEEKDGNTSYSGISCTGQGGTEGLEDGMSREVGLDRGDTWLRAPRKGSSTNLTLHVASPLRQQGGVGAMSALGANGSHSQQSLREIIKFGGSWTPRKRGEWIAACSLHASIPSLPNPRTSMQASDEAHRERPPISHDKSNAVLRPSPVTTPRLSHPPPSFDPSSSSTSKPRNHRQLPSPAVAPRPSPAVPHSSPAYTPRQTPSMTPITCPIHSSARPDKNRGRGDLGADGGRLQLMSGDALKTRARSVKLDAKQSLGTKLVYDAAKNMLSTGQSKVGYLELLRGGGEGLGRGLRQERGGDMWQLVQVSVDDSGVVDCKLAGDEADSSSSWHLGNVRDCDRLELLCIDGKAHVMRLIWRDGSDDLLSAPSYHNALEWKAVFTCLHSTLDESIVSFLASINLVARYSQGDIFGHQGSGHLSAYHAESARRTSTVVCEESGSSVLSLSQQDYVRIFQQGGGCMSIQSKVRILSTCEELCLMKPLDLMALAKSSTVIQAFDKQVIVRAGSAADTFYVVSSGSLSACVKDDEYFGEGGLMWAMEAEQEEYRWRGDQEGNSGSQTARERGKWGVDRDVLHLMRGGVMRRVFTLACGDAFGHDEATSGRHHTYSLVAEGKSQLLAIPCETLRAVLNSMAISLRDKNKHSDADDAASAPRVRLGTAGEDDENGDDNDVTDGLSLDHGRIVKQASGNSNMLIQGAFDGLDTPTPSLDHIISRYTPRAGDCKKMRFRGNASKVQSDGVSLGSRGHAAIGSMGSSLNQVPEKGVEVISCPTHDDMSESAGHGGVGFLSAGHGGVGFLSAEVARSILGEGNPRTDVSVRLDIIRKQFRQPVKGSDFAAKGYETRWGSHAASRKANIVSTPKIDLQSLRLKETKTVSSIQDWEAQLRFQLSDKERDLVSDMRKVIGVKNESLKSLAQRAMHVILKLHRGSSRLEMQSSSGCKIAKFESLGGGLPAAIEDTLRCALSELAVTASTADDLAQHHVTLAASSPSSFPSPRIGTAITPRTPRSRGTQTWTPRGSSRGTQARLTLLPGKGINHKGLGRRGSVLRLSVSRGLGQSPPCTVQGWQGGIKLEIAKDNLRPYTAPFEMVALKP